MHQDDPTPEVVQPWSAGLPANLTAVIQASILDDDTPIAGTARFLASVPDSVRYVNSVGWHIFTGDRWVHDVGDHLVVQQALRVTAAHLAQTNPKNSRAQVSLGFVRESLAYAAGLVLAEPDDFDGNPYLLGLPGGQTLDLVTRRRRPMVAEDMITRLAGVHPDIPDPESEHYLAQLLNGMFPDPEIREYVRAAIAYTLTGSVHEERMFVLFDAEDGHPQGRRGKSTLLDTLRRAMGDLAMQAPDSLLLYRKTEAIPTDVAALKGRRLAWANELPDAAPLDEARLKQIVSTGAVAARFMRQDYFTFTPTHHIWVTTNTIPSIRDTGEGVWRRLTLLPVSSGLHDSPVYDRDGNLAHLAALPSEPAFQAALMRWALPALHTSIAHLPNALSGLTESHRANQDVYGSFVAEMLSVVEEPATPAGGALTRKQIWMMFIDWSADDRQRIQYRNQARLVTAVRARVPAGGESVYSGQRYFPHLRVRQSG